MTVWQRDKRLSLQLPVEVRGEDAAGSLFRELTRTVNVSGRGICFESHRHIVIGARLDLAIELPPALRRHFGGVEVYRSRAAVCRVERFSGEAASRIGARFLGGEAGPD